jgi:hypothetical protein
LTSGLWSLIALAFTVGGIVLGTSFARLADRHLSPESKEVVKLGTGLIATLAALVLGLLIASAKSSFDAQNAYVKRITADLVLLDRLLARYGAEADATRGLMRRAEAEMVDSIWRTDASNPVGTAPFEARAAGEQFYDRIDELTPGNDIQRTLKARAVQTIADLVQTRLLLFAQLDNSIPTPFLVVLIFWLTIIFASFSLFSKPNAIVVAALVAFAVSASSAIFLILDLNQPFTGLMQVSSEQLRHALAPLGS